MNETMDLREGQLLYVARR